MLTVGLLGVGGVAYYLATKKEGSTAPSLDLQGIIDAITGFFGNLIPKPTDGDGNGKPPPSKCTGSKIECKDGKCDTQANCDKQASCKSGEHWDPDTKKCAKPSPPPPTGGGGSVVFGAAGDWGSARNSNWKKTADLMIKAKIQTALGLGDYSYGSVAQWQPVPDYLKKAGIPMKGAQGNHDSAAYAKTFTAQSSMLYTFNQGPARVVILNTESTPSLNASFLTTTMNTNKQPWVILIMHKPLYTNASNHGAETALANALKPIINKYKIPLVMYGHNHNYQRILKSDQPYTVFVCSGTGGESHYTLKGNLAGTKYMNDTDFGFTKISISGSKLIGQFITHSGAVKDTWTQTLGATAKLAYVYPAYAYEAMVPRISI